MGRPGPETRLIDKMRQEAHRVFGKRLVIVKYHGDEYGESGVSDLLCCIEGIFVAVEVKAPEGTTGHGVTRKQAAFLDRVSRAGGYVAVVRSVEQFISVLWAAVENGALPAEEFLETE